MNVLIVDDNLQSRRLLEYFLSSLNCAHDSVDNGKSSLSMLKEKHYDVIILDWRMPHFNGRQTLLELKNLPANKFSVIIYSSCHFHEIDLKDIYHPKIRNFISKKLSPYRQVEMLKESLAYCKAEPG